MTGETEALEYLDRVLRLDPLTDAERIVEERARFLGAESLAHPEDTAEDDLVAELSELAEQLWTIDDAAFDAIVADLAPRAAGGAATAWLSRLITARAARDELERARIEGGDIASLVDDLTTIAVAPPDAIARQRLEALDKFRLDAKQRASYLARRYPKLAALDSEYLDRMRTLVRDRNRADRLYRELQPTRQSEGVPFWVWFLAAWVVIKILTALAGAGR